MAMVYAHNGDIIVIDRKEYEVVSDPTTREDLFTLQLKRLMCIACGENDVDGDEGWDRFCPGCINQAMRWVVVMETIEKVVPENVQKVIEHDAEEMDKSRVGGFQYIELSSSAWDSIGADGRDELAEQVNDVFETVKRAIVARVGA